VLIHIDRCIRFIRQTTNRKNSVACSEFVKEAGKGGRGILPVDGALTVVQSEPWDGKDGEIIEEDEFSLEDLMGDDSTPKDEL
jgi:protein disulfide-isomerase A6